MNKILSIVTLFVLMVVPIFATAIHVPIDYPVIQESIGTQNTTDTFLFSKGKEYFHEMESENESSEKIRFTLGEVKLLSGQKYTKLDYPDKGCISELGMPELPIFSTFYQIDPYQEYEVEFSGIQSRMINDIIIFPYQGIDADNSSIEVDYIKSDFYNEDATFPDQNLVISEPLIMRGIQFLNVSVIPFKYYPDQQQLEVFDVIEIIVKETGEKGNQEFISVPKSKTFEELYSDMILNYEPTRDFDEYQQPAVLYICGGSSENNPYFQQLVSWRHKRGYVVYTASTSEIGYDPYDIKGYIQYSYETFDPPPEFVGLVGDADGSFSVPTFFESWSGYSGEGDMPYSQLDGDDLFPEVLIGRLSFQNTTQLVVIVNKIISYETAQEMNSMPSYYDRAALVGDPSESGVSTIITNEYIEEIMLAHGMTDVRTNFGSGNYADWMVNQLNEGVLYFNYRGFIGASGLNTSELNNGYMLPFAVVLTCATGSFASGTSLSEDFLIIGSPSTPRGAIASVGTATTGTHTRFNNIVDMGIFDGIFPKGLETTGAALANGKLALYNTYPSNLSNWVSIFSHWNNLMGDPATHLWTKKPVVLDVYHDTEIQLGSNFIDIEVQDEFGGAIEGAMVTLLKGNDEIFVSKYSDEMGQVMFPLNYSSTGIIYLTVTKKNYQPYQGVIDITSGPSISLDYQQAILVVDNEDGLLNPGETVGISIPLKNFGSTNIEEVVATLNSSSEYVTITNPTVYYGSIDPGQSQYGFPNFGFTLSGAAINGEDLEFRLDITDNISLVEWQSFVPVDVYGCYLIVDGSGFVEPGETVDFAITLRNSGSFSANDVVAELIYSGELVTVVDGSAIWGEIQPGESVESLDAFTISISTDVINGTILPLNLHIQSSDGYDRHEYYDLQIGEVSVFDPLGPDQYGYYIYDSGDFDYILAPEYNWIEIVPNYGGSGTNLNLSDYGNGIFDNAIAHVDLPFTFQYYGIEYDEITVCTNGWIAFGHSELESFRNYPVPGPGGPSKMVAAFWDDLKTTQSPGEIPPGENNIDLTSLFSGETISGNWKIWVQDTYGDGGCYATDILFILNGHEFELTDSPSNYNHNTYEELGWTDVEVSQEGIVFNATIEFTWNVDSWPEESSLWVESPQGTVSSIVPNASELSANVFIYNDINNEYFVIEWSELSTHVHDTPETFQIILFNNSVQPYGDGEIKIQYKVFNNTSFSYGDHGQYCTVGIENHLSTVGLQYTFNNTYPSAAMELDDETAIFITTRPSVDISELTLPVSFMEDWNLIGLPVMVPNSNYAFLFPDAIDNTLYSFNGSYVSEDMLVTGNGFWLRFENSGSVNITGGNILDQAVNLYEGWNLVSGISQSVYLNNISDPDELIIPGTLYDYGEIGYMESWILEPGKGYWLRTYEPGVITLTSGALAKTANQDFSLNANNISINGSDLYFGVGLSQRERLSYSLPPKPPAGAFDVRFKDGWRVVKDYGEVEVMPTTETLTISYDISLNAGEHHNWVLSSETLDDYVLEDAGELTVPSAERFILERKAVVPATFTLHQNFPNPFNPITTLRYDLPSDALVTLSIYDMLGREITQLVNITQQAGFKSVQWDATDSKGRPVSAGVYLYQIQAGEFVQTKKMVLLK